MNAKEKFEQPTPPRIPFVGEDLRTGNAYFWKPSENPHEGDRSTYDEGGGDPVERFVGGGE